MPCIRVALADDHPIVRSGFHHLLEQAPDISVVGEASTGMDALRMVDELTPDVLVLDIEMPGLTGVEVARRLLEAGAPVRVLMLSVHDDAQYIRAALRSGAVGYLTKDEAPGVIVEAVRGVARGEDGWCSRGVTAKLMQEQRVRTRAQTAGSSSLSAREQQVLRLLARGADNDQIAKTLYLSLGTVKNHVANIYDKLRVHTRADAVTWAWQEGLMSAAGDDKDKE